MRHPQQVMLPLTACYYIIKYDIHIENEIVTDLLLWRGDIRRGCFTNKN